MMTNDLLVLGYDLIKWEEQGLKEAILTDVSVNCNSHMVISGMSGSGKSYASVGILARFFEQHPDCEVYFADYKQEQSYEFLKHCPHYYPYQHTLEALDLVYDKLQKRQSGEDKSQNPIILWWDEYASNILSLQNSDKKFATSIMNKVGEILMLGRSLNIRFWVVLQRPDSSLFAVGSRLNFAIVILLGASIKSIYEMMIPDHMHMVGSRNFKRGEGVLLLQGSELRFIKIPTVRDENRMKELCIKALS